MIKVNGPIEIKTKLVTILITVQDKDAENGRNLIEVFQKNGNSRYWMGGTLEDGDLHKECTDE